MYPRIPDFETGQPDEGPAALGHRALLFVLHYQTAAGLTDQAAALAIKAAVIAIAARETAPAILATINQAIDLLAATVRGRRQAASRPPVDSCQQAADQAPPLAGGSLVPRQPVPPTQPPGAWSQPVPTAARPVTRPTAAPARPPVLVDF